MESASANCVNPGQEAAVAAAQQAATSSPVVTEINACGGDDTSYRIPLSVDVTFDGRTFSNIYVTTNSVITFGRPDGTYWTYPSTPSISLYSMDWVVYPFARADERLVIRSSDGGFQVDISARPIWLQSAPQPTNIVITAAILSDGTVAMAYSVDGPTYDGQTRTGVRLNDGSIVDFETYGIEQITESPSLSPVATTESPFVPEPTESPTVSPEPTESPSVSPEPTQSPTVSPEPTESPSLSPETESPTTSPETESQTVSPDISESPTVSPEIVDPNRIVLIVNEGNVMSYVAPEGYKIDRIESASYGFGDWCHAVDSQIIVESAVTNDSFTISADNGVFGDPCGGTYKRLEVVVIIEPLPANESTESQTVSPVTESATSSPEPSPEPVQPPILPQPVEPSPEPSPEPPIILPTPEPTPSPEPTPEPEPEPTPTPEPTPEPTLEPEPTPEPTEEPTPEPIPTPEPTEEPTEEPSPSPEPPIDKEPEPIVPEPEPEKKPTPTEEPVKVEIAEPITAENIEALVEELNTIAPQDLTTEQQELIVAAALEVFQDAEKGSEEYEAALEALLVVAQADDIVLNEELAAIPLIGNVAGAAVEVFNALGNAGADMSPQVREQSEKVVIAAVIVGQVAMTAVASATSAASVAARRP